MPLLALDDLDLAYRGRQLFAGASLSIERGDRLGVVGPNGTGKSTLLKILVGETQADSVEITRARGLRIGYLPQELPAGSQQSLLESLLARAPGRATLELEIQELESQLSASDDPDEQLARAAELADRHEILLELETSFGPHRAEAILVGLGFAHDAMTRPLSSFSGGWRMRAALAALLYERPDVLLLDEPTNHLDLASVAWLNRFLGSVSRALVLICHDREFLNRHINRVASLEVDGLRHYRGNYDDYLIQRELDLEHLESRQKREEARKKELEAFVDRFKAKASKARQAQSKAKIIEKLEASQIEVPKVRRAMALKFAPCERSGDVVLALEDVGFAYDRPLFEGVSGEIRRGDRIAIVGRNGMGKTTLLKLIAGELKPRAGQIRLGHKVTPSYFAQHHADQLRESDTVLDAVWSAAPALSQTEARSICGSFLFSGDDVDKPVAVLSGGERARVALGRLLAAPGNFLLLDEPTNHLDIESAEKLTQSLEEYDGTLVFVSHNLDFARRLSAKVWDVEGSRLRVYPGSLGEYLEQLDREAAETAAESSRAPGSTEPSRDARRDRRRAEADDRKQRQAREKKLAETEAEIARLETEQAELEAVLADPKTHQDETRAKQSASRYREVQTALENALLTWERLENERSATA